jgi:glutamate N-acetyltransferase/amino-acid N-acetyltransferase
VHAGIKKDGSSLDLGLVLSAHPTTAAACFTRNVFQAAPVQVSREVVTKSGGKARGLVVNSGCANAVTGKRGLEDAWTMSRAVDDILRTYGTKGSEDESGGGGSLVMSTGVIGQPLPIDKISKGIEAAGASLSSSFESWYALATAFMTTDTFPKLRTRSFSLGGQQVRFVGIDKGAGMIHPNMGPPHATLLGLIATDASVEPQSLQKALTYAVERSFNSISVDGDMSTNDTVAILANGAAGGIEVAEGTDRDEYERFRDQLTDFAVELASLIVRDGEGATKFVKISVEVSAVHTLLGWVHEKGLMSGWNTLQEAPTYRGAHHIASTIARSSLVKTAIHGEDANWGRILCAIGYSNPDFDVNPTKVSVSFVPADGSEELRLLVDGEPENVDEKRASEILAMEDLEIRVRLALGEESAAYYTCDLSKVMFLFFQGWGKCDVTFIY